MTADADYLSAEDRKILDFMFDNMRPVSYTHLTLPTILLV